MALTYCLVGLQFEITQISFKVVQGDWKRRYSKHRLLAFCSKLSFYLLSMLAR